MTAPEAGLPMMRTLYNIVMYLLSPVIVYRLAFRGLRAPAYFVRWRERFGWIPKPAFARSIWIHAVSVGEVNAAVPLIQELMKRFPEHGFVVTTVTPTGSDRVIQVFGDRVYHAYLPYDLTASVKRFIRRVRPRLTVVMETEIWPNLFCECREQGIPVVVANARLSEQSLRGYRPVRALAAMALRASSAVAAQTETDAARLRKLGGPSVPIEVVGSLKFDTRVDASILENGRRLRAQWGDERLVWVAASTHEDDEGPVLDVFERLLQRDPEALLVLVPRHPERFNRALLACRARGLRTVQRSVERIGSRTTQCFLVDAMGELMDFYAASDMAFVGGSLAHIGGHNVLEPAAVGKPVLVGPHTYNFAEITQMLLQCGGARRVADGNQLWSHVEALATDPELRRAMGRAARELVLRERGAVDRTMQIIERVTRPAPAVATGGSPIDPPPGGGG